ITTTETAAIGANTRATITDSAPSVGRSAASRATAAAAAIASAATTAGLVCRRTIRVTSARGGGCVRGPVPGDRALEALPQLGPRLEPEELAGAGHVEPSARLAVRRLGVPLELAVEARQLGHQLGEVADRDLVPRAEVHRLRPAVARPCGRNPLGGVLDVEELARRAPV